MFPKCSPGLRHPRPFRPVFPSLLTGFHGTDFPAFYRYYGDAKTASALLLTFGFPRWWIPYTVLPVSLRLIRWQYRPDWPGHFICGMPLLTAFRLEAGGSPKFPQKPLVYLPNSKTPNGLLSACLLSPYHCCSRPNQSGNSFVYSFEATCLVSTLPVYASCCPFSQLRNTRFRLLAKLCRVGLHTYRFLKISFKERFFSPYYGLCLAQEWLIC